MIIEFLSVSNLIIVNRVCRLWLDVMCARGSDQLLTGLKGCGGYLTLSACSLFLFATSVSLWQLGRASNWSAHIQPFTIINTSNQDLGPAATRHSQFSPLVLEGKQARKNVEIDGRNAWSRRLCDAAMSRKDAKRSQKGSLFMLLGKYKKYKYICRYTTAA